MSKKQKKKEKLFDLYSTSLAINSNLTDWFICPLCHRGFKKEHLESLTLEHIIPQSLGGKLVTLTCWKCNKRVGQVLTGYEQDTKKRNKSIDLLRSDSR
ncbi:MAG: HNH endonuclease, partial [Anaerolineales bacterium]|nr:HNH endonuclease [Anaerolineales bacterium]